MESAVSESGRNVVVATLIRCACCGTQVAGAPVTGLLREVRYDYCGPDCRDRHADAVLAGPQSCELCDLDAIGDTPRCSVHLDTVPEEPGYLLAS